MARKSPKSQPPAKRPPEENPPAENPLASAGGRAWLEAELARAEYDVRFGPGGQGWACNETKRPAVLERAAFLRALIAALP